MGSKLNGPPNSASQCSWFFTALKHLEFYSFALSFKGRVSFYLSFGLVCFAFETRSLVAQVGLEDQP